jgi:hypothetical protein
MSCPPIGDYRDVDVARLAILILSKGGLLRIESLESMWKVNNCNDEINAVCCKLIVMTQWRCRRCCRCRCNRVSAVLNVADHRVVDGDTGVPSAAL